MGCACIIATGCPRCRRAPFRRIWRVRIVFVRRGRRGRGNCYSIDSNKIDLMPQLRSLLGLGPLAWLTLALGVASLLTRLQDLWRGRSDPGGIDKGHLRLEAATGTN